MAYVPHEKLSVGWAEDGKSLALSLPWMSMEIDVTEEDTPWISDALNLLHTSSSHSNVQKFIHQLKDYPLFYIQPRSLEEFQRKDLQACPELTVDSSTPERLISTFGCEIAEELKESALPAWTWEREKILSKSRIHGTDLYDPISLITYLICYRLEWESTTWSGQDGFGQFLERLLRRNEDQFFKAIGWVAKQSWGVTSEFGKCMEPALTHFKKGKELIHHFIYGEEGHHKFMEQVFKDIDLNKEDFPVSEGTKWLLRAHKRAATISPLAFSAMINLFEAAFYEGQDPISRVIELSSKPYAAQGYDLHYKINQEHRHCDMPVRLGSYLAPQSYSHVMLTLGLFELTLNFLDNIEKDLAKKFELH
ncbi:MAG: hypothetical protein K2P93_01930 [Alphaproteobacteria bacterium]|nr:hypothetical protein [Alphaproteobacteria bacterium]